jgi:tetratricopeptide (TPR) repeat protein
MRSIAAFLLLASAALADVVHLKSGGKLEGRVTEEGDSVKVDTGYGTVTLKRADVDRIEKKEFTPPAKPAFTKTPPRLRDSYAHPFYGFKIYLPVGWGPAPQKEAQKVSFYGPKEQLYTPRFDLTVRATKTAVADLVNSLKNTYLKEYKDVIFQYEEATAIHGREGYQFLAVFTDGAVKMRSIWTIVGTEGLLYTLGFSCTDAWFDKYHSKVDASMRSLRLFGLPKASLDQRKEFDRLYTNGYSLAKEGKTAEALASFRKAADLVPEFPNIHGVVGQLCARTGNMADAETAFKKALELDPQDYEFAFNLGVVLLQQQKFEGAIDALGRAAKADPTMEPALTNLGVAYLGKDQPALAVDALSRAVLADPEAAPAHYNLGMAYERLDRKKDAEKEFEETLKLDPQHQGAKDGLARLKK